MYEGELPSIGSFCLILVKGDIHYVVIFSNPKAR